MFDLVHKHKHIAQGILALITLPFAFFGVDYYVRGDKVQSVATVGGDKIQQQEYDDLLRDQQQRMRQALGGNFDPSMLETPEMRYALLDQLVNQRLLEQRARADRLRVSDTQLQQFIAGLPPFQEDGKFSADKYRQVLSAQGMSPLMFEQRVRGELVLSPLQDPIVNGSIAAQTSVQRYLALLEQKRDVAVAPIAAEPFEKSVKVSDADVKAFYDKNPTAFQSPEVAKIEYLLLNQDAIAAQVKVEPAELKQAYDANSKQYTTNEERQASHILISVKPDASEADKAAAKQKATALLEKARAKPDAFADLAKANSQDTGSAAQGGDLGSFARGAMVKPFEDAVFAAKVGDIVGPVQSDFGFHVIKVTRITPPHVQTFDEVKPRIEAEVRRQKAAAEIRRGSRPVPEPRLRTGRFARRCGQGTRPEGGVDAIPDACAGAGGGARQCEVRAGAVLARIPAEQAQHGSDRNRAEHADGRPHRRVQARRRRGRSPTCRMKSVSSSCAVPRARWRRRPVARSLHCSSRARTARQALRSASRLRWCATNRSPDSRPMR